ncbi:MAG TPA: hypothetical protein ENH62_14710 [Marinobacter sp.]|uniref:Uncharacterized protein n=1 Tax=marine sediment metagenome TaxID=412755 RepID=A0A0F9KRS0_9ZZZZ|nr:hypothetical protein [Marinobacter sp.]
MKEPVDHIERPRLPWRNVDEPAVTECGYDASKVNTLTRDEFFARLKDLGKQRTAMLTCMTCVDTARRWPIWEDEPRKALEREINWECGWRRRKNGHRLKDELLAIEALIAAHREEFNELLEARRQRQEWLDRKNRQVTS